MTFAGPGRAELTAHPLNASPEEGEIVGESLISLISSGSEYGGFSQKASQSPGNRIVYRNAKVPQQPESVMWESLQALGAQNQSCGALMECSGNENALRASLPYLRKGAEAIQIGVPWHKCSDWSAHDLRISEIWTAYQRDGEEALSWKKTGRKVGSGMILTPEEQEEIRGIVIEARPEAEF